ncbi:MAG: hypothetical protein Q8P44_05585 [Dehalococcoidia bacterium]|nr:hypothetical protein [Dehalococcoidia bacterium]
MAKRTKKPSILPEQRWNWLRRSEAGESAPQIAQKDFCDVRTVRIHIEKAKQERELKDARATVLRTALERHYEDLCNFAARLDPLSIRSFISPPPPAEDEVMEAALRQHLPRSPIWNYLASTRNLQRENAEIMMNVKQKIEKAVRAERRLAPLLSAGLSEVVPGIINALNYQVGQWSIGGSGLTLEDNLLIEPAGQGKGQLCYGSSRMATVKREDAKKYLRPLRKIIDSLEHDITSWEEYGKLRKTNEEIGRLDRKLHEELLIIKLRRIVPGRCRYCPL